MHPFARALSLHGVQLFAFTAKRQISPREIRLDEGAGFAFMTADQVRELDLIPAAGKILHHFIDNMDNIP